MSLGSRLMPLRVRLNICYGIIWSGLVRKSDGVDEDLFEDRHIMQREVVFLQCENSFVMPTMSALRSFQTRLSQKVWWGRVWVPVTLRTSPHVCQYHCAAIFC